MTLGNGARPPTAAGRESSRRGILTPDTAGLVDRLLHVAMRGLPTMYRPDTDEFVFTRAAGSDGRVESRGTSTRYAAIVALGAGLLAEPEQRRVLRGRSVEDLVTILIDRLGRVDNVGDVALVCWAAAEVDHPRLAEALARLGEVDASPRPRYVVEAAWVLDALVAARGHADVEARLARARERLLASRHVGSPVFPHATASGLVPWYRGHVACFADQVYPIQALARLHRSADDAQALRAATECADRICQLQGSGGQWWWHYDARNGRLVEGYPVYTVHQHAMAPMALLDLADAGGGDYREPIERGLRWISGPDELGPQGESMVLDADGVTWRKVWRGDPGKLVRAAHGLTSRVLPTRRAPGVDRLYRPGAIDRECRPYEFGWLLFTWLDGAGASTMPSVAWRGAPADGPVA